MSSPKPRGSPDAALTTMTMESSTADADGGSNDRDTIAPNVDERPKTGGTAVDSTSQAMSTLMADEEDGRDDTAPGRSIQPAQADMRRAT